MVAVDDSGHPAPIPGLRCESPEEQRRERAAQMRRTNRLAEREELVRHREREHDLPAR
jgi:acyl-CoA hydrolase